MAEKYIKCLLNDEENEGRGKTMAQEARSIWGTIQSRVRTGATPAQQLDLREIATHELHPFENAWTAANTTR